MRKLLLASAALIALAVSTQATERPGITSGANVNWATIGSNKVPAAALATGAAAANLGYTPLVPANNLSDIGNAATARTNLGLGPLATQSTVNLATQVTGTLANSGLANPSMTVNGTTCTLGASCSPGYTNMVFNEVPSGAVNGTNKVFTIATAPAAGYGGVSSLHLYLNGQLQEDGGNDYTLSGTTITMLIAPAPINKLRADYLR